jgi:hypothetical protein
MNSTDKIHIPLTLFTQMIDDEILILDTQSQNYFALEGMGRIMWEYISEHHSCEGLEQHILEMVDVDVSQLREDIAVFIETLKKNRLITIGKI